MNLFLPRLLSTLGVASRAEAVRLIRAGRVRVNGRVVNDARARVPRTAHVSVDDEDVVRRWWFKTRSVPLLVDTRVAAGHPITANTGVRLDAIASRHRDGYSAREIQDDTGATETEVVAAILAA